VERRVKVGGRTRYEHRLEPFGAASENQVALKRSLLDGGRLAGED
jgi:hypothetical protein